MFLTADQIIDISGYKTKKHQIKWLRNNGIRFLVAADGSPRVMHNHLRDILCHPPNQKYTNRKEPNFQALQSHGEF